MCHYVLLQFQCPVLKEFKLTFAARNRKHYFCVIQRCSSNCQVLKNSISWKIETWNCFCFLKVMKIHIFQIKKISKSLKNDQDCLLTSITWMILSIDSFIDIFLSTYLIYSLFNFIEILSVAWKNWSLMIYKKFYLLLGKIDPWWYIRPSFENYLTLTQILVTKKIVISYDIVVTT